MCSDDEFKDRIQQGLEGEISELKTELAELNKKVKGCATLTNAALRETKEYKRRAEEWATKLQLVKESVQGVCAERDKWKQRYEEGLQTVSGTIGEQRDQLANENRELKKLAREVIAAAKASSSGMFFWLGELETATEDKKGK